MKLLIEFFVEVIFQRILVGFLGHYTLLFIFKLFGYKKGLDWLTAADKDERGEFGNGCFIALVGLVVLGVIVALFMWIYYDILSLG